MWALLRDLVFLPSMEDEHISCIYSCSSYAANATNALNSSYEGDCVDLVIPSHLRWRSAMLS